MWVTELVLANLCVHLCVCVNGCAGHFVHISAFLKGPAANVFRLHSFNVVVFQAIFTHDVISFNLVVTVKLHIQESMTILTTLSTLIYNFEMKLRLGHRKEM